MTFASKKRKKRRRQKLRSLLKGKGKEDTTSEGNTGDEGPTDDEAQTPSSKAMANGKLTPSPLKFGPSGSDVHVGLYNLGNTCFLNACLAMLINSPMATFADSPIARTHWNECPRARTGANNVAVDRRKCPLCLWLAFCQKFKAGKKFAPTDLANSLHLFQKNLRLGRQHDAHEFLICFLEKIGDLKTGLEKLWTGKTTQSIKCHSCQRTSSTKSIFTTLPIALGSSIQHGLDQFGQADQLSGKNSYECEVCKKLTHATRSTRIVMPPRLFLIQIQRFDAFGRKLKKDPYLNPVLKLDVLVSNKARHEPKDDKEATSSTITRRTIHYHLCGSVIHLGATPSSGHYIANFKPIVDKTTMVRGEWMTADDECISRGTSRGGAYLCMYIRKE